MNDMTAENILQNMIGWAEDDDVLYRMDADIERYFAALNFDDYCDVARAARDLYNALIEGVDVTSPLYKSTDAPDIGVQSGSPIDAILSGVVYAGWAAAVKLIAQAIGVNPQGFCGLVSEQFVFGPEEAAWPLTIGEIRRDVRLYNLAVAKHTIARASEILVGNEQ